MVKILLAEDNELNRDMLMRRLEHRGYQVDIAIDGEEAIAKVRSHCPDLLLLDISLPILDGFEVARRIREDPQLCALPILGLSAHAMQGDRERALAAGCDDYDTKPVEMERLLDKIQLLFASCKQAMKSDPGMLLVVDDNEMNRDILSRRLTRLGYVVVVAENGQSALNMLLEHKFDLVLLDIEMPGIDGIAVLKLIRTTYSMSELPVIMVTARGESTDIVGALELGANDYIMKPLDLAVVPARVRTQLALKRASDEVRMLASQLEARNTLIRSIFGRYVASEVVDKLLASPEALEFGGELRMVTVLVADLRGFTLISEGPFTPVQVVHMLNNFLGTMTKIIADHHGIVDEILGDGMLAFFGAPSEQPDHAQRAVGCAVAMQQAMTSVNAYNQTHSLPELSMGIGIHTGEAIVGNIGSETRSKYSVVGKHVNLAARLESYCCGNQILISEATLSHTGAIVRIDGQFIVHPKGVADPVTVYEAGGIATYNSFLPRYTDELQALQQAITVNCAIIDEKSISEETFACSLTRLSAKAAEIVTIRAVSPLTNIAIYLLPDNFTDQTTCLYGKVVAYAGDADNCVCVRFTCMLPQTRAVLADLLRRNSQN